MEIIKRFFADTKKYLPYSIRAGKAALKADVAESHLSWLWWVLDPLLFMLVYSFVSLVIFGKSEKYFTAFIFIGYTSYNLFQDTLKSSVRLVANNKSIIKNVYMPKIVLMYTKLYVNLFSFVVGFALVFCAMAIYRVPLSWRIIYVIPLILLLILLSFSLGTILLHFGVYVEDLSNVIHVALRLMFYLSGIFYSLEKRVKSEFLQAMLLKANPMAYIINELRKALLYKGDFDYKTYFIWLAFSLVVLYVGVQTIYKNENGYVKVI